MRHVLEENRIEELELERDEQAEQLSATYASLERARSRVAELEAAIAAADQRAAEWEARVGQLEKAALAAQARINRAVFLLDEPSDHEGKISSNLHRAVFLLGGAK